MAFAFSSKRNAIENAKHVAAQEIDKALAELHDNDLDEGIRVHQVRKRCKKLRGLLRLIRPAIGDQYATENATLRDAAALLSRARTMDTMRSTYDAILEEFEPQLKRKAFGTIRRQLTEEKKELESSNSAPENRYGSVESALRAVGDRISAWTFEAQGFDVLGDGFKKTYKKARHFMESARGNRHAEEFHEWRKHVKYHWYHCRLLAPTWPKRMKRRVDRLKKLADDLGFAHDLADLLNHLEAAPHDFGDNATVSFFRHAATFMEGERYDRCLANGDQLFRDSPSSLRDQAREYWREARQPSED